MRKQILILLFICLPTQAMSHDAWKWLSLAGLAGIATIPVIWGIKRLRANKQQMIGKKQVIEGKTIQQYQGIFQGYSLDCGYHAVYNACCLYSNDLDGLLNFKKFKKESTLWKRTVGKTNITSGDIEKIIKTHVPTLRKYQDVSIIDCIESMDNMIEQGAIGGIDHHTMRNIQRFRVKKKPQIVILNTSSGDIYTYYNKSWHWLAVKLEHTKDNMVQMTVVDSLSNIGTNHTKLDQLYNLFVNTDLPGKDLS